MLDEDVLTPTLVVKKRPGRPKRVDPNKKQVYHGKLSKQSITDDIIELVSDNTSEIFKVPSNINLFCVLNSPIVIQKIIKALKNFTISSVMFYFTSDGIVIGDVLMNESKPSYEIEIIIPASKMFMYYCDKPYSLRFNYSCLKGLVYGFSKDTLQLKIISDEKYNESITFTSVSNESKLEQLFEYSSLLGRVSNLNPDIKYNDIIRPYDYHKIEFACHIDAFKQVYGKLCNIKKEVESVANIYLESYTNNAKCSVMLNSNYTNIVAKSLDQNVNEEYSFELIRNNVDYSDMLMSTIEVNYIKCIEPLGSVNKKIYVCVIDDITKFNKFTVYNDPNKHSLLPDNAICVNIYIPTVSSSVNSTSYNGLYV